MVPVVSRPVVRNRLFLDAPFLSVPIYLSCDVFGLIVLKGGKFDFRFLQMERPMFIELHDEKINVSFHEG